jgi:hypothetical protein
MEMSVWHGLRKIDKPSRLKRATKKCSVKNGNEKRMKVSKQAADGGCARRALYAVMYSC